MSVTAGCLCYTRLFVMAVKWKGNETWLAQLFIISMSTCSSIRHLLRSSKPFNWFDFKKGSLGRLFAKSQGLNVARLEFFFKSLKGQDIFRFEISIRKNVLLIPVSWLKAAEIWTRV